MHALIVPSSTCMFTACRHMHHSCKNKNSIFSLRHQRQSLRSIMFPKRFYSCKNRPLGANKPPCTIPGIFVGYNFLKAHSKLCRIRHVSILAVGSLTYGCLLKGTITYWSDIVFLLKLCILQKDVSQDEKRNKISRSSYSLPWQRNVNDTPIRIFSTFKIQ